MAGRLTFVVFRREYEFAEPESKASMPDDRPRNLSEAVMRERMTTTTRRTFDGRGRVLCYALISNSSADLMCTQQEVA